jgi:hypothetical protein
MSFNSGKIRSCLGCYKDTHKPWCPDCYPGHETITKKQLSHSLEKPDWAKDN